MIVPATAALKTVLSFDDYPTVQPLTAARRSNHSLVSARSAGSAKSQNAVQNQATSPTTVPNHEFNAKPKATWSDNGDPAVAAIRTLTPIVLTEDEPKKKQQTGEWLIDQEDYPLQRPKTSIFSKCTPSFRWSFSNGCISFDVLSRYFTYTLTFGVIITLIALLVLYLVEKQQEATQALVVADAVTVTRPFSACIHEYQVERGLAAMFITVVLNAPEDLEQVKDGLLQQYRRTNHAQEDLAAFVKQWAETVRKVDHFDLTFNATKFDEIIDVRFASARLSLTPGAVLAWYTDRINDMLAVVIKATVAASSDKAVARLLGSTALAFVMEGMGLEHGTGTAFFMGQDASIDSLMSYAAVQARRDLLMNAFVHPFTDYAYSARWSEIWGQSEESMVVIEDERQINELALRGTRPSDGVGSWFWNFTSVSEATSEMHTDLLTEIQLSALSRSTVAEESFTSFVGVVCAAGVALLANISYMFWLRKKDAKLESDRHFARILELEKLHNQMQMASKYVGACVAMRFSQLPQDLSQDPLELQMRSLVANMKMYRPYLPKHLIIQSRHKNGDDDADTEEGETKVASTTEDPSISNKAGEVKAVTGPSKVVKAKGRRIRASATEITHTTTTAVESDNTDTTKVSSSHLTDEGLRPRQVTILAVALTRFGDLKEAEVIQKMVGRMVTALDDAVYKEKGLLQHIVGDTAICSWNTAQKVSNHQHRACRTALALCESFRSLSRANIGYRMGIASGPALIGTVGSDKTKTFQVFCRTTQRAVELRELNKVLGTKILLMDDVSSYVRHFCEIKPVDIVAEQSKDEEDNRRNNPDVEAFFTPVPGGRVVFELLKDIEHEDNEWMYQLENSSKSSPLADYMTAFGAFVQGRYDAAQTLFHQHMEENGRDAAALRFTRVINTILTKRGKNEPLPAWTPDWDRYIRHKQFVWQNYPELGDSAPVVA